LSQWTSHIGRTNTHRDFQWAAQEAAVHALAWPVDISDKKEARLEKRQNLKDADQLQQFGGPEAAGC
jgi:hypothetical protein